MARSDAVWGIDIGQCSLKALRCRAGEGGKRVVADAFDFIAYPKILSQPGADPAELIQEALTLFLSRNSVRGDRVAILFEDQKITYKALQASVNKLGSALKGYVWEDWSVAGLIYFTTVDGNVWALQDTGPGAPPAAPVWKQPVAGASSPLVLESLWVGSSDGKLHQLNLTSGVDEKQVTIGDGTATVGDVSTENGTELFVGTTAGTLYKLPLPLP